MMDWNTTRYVGLMLATLLVLGSFGCAQTKNAKVDSRYELTMTLQNFHRDLRWEEFERAATVVHPAHKQVFMGRYEELGKDLDIVGLEVKKVTATSTNRREVEVEQKWLIEPDMTVKEKRFVEVWNRTERGWMLRRRLRKDEWKRQQKEKRENTPDESSEPPSTDQPDATTAEAGS